MLALLTRRAVLIIAQIEIAWGDGAHLRLACIAVVFHLVTLRIRGHNLIGIKSLEVGDIIKRTLQLMLDKPDFQRIRSDAVGKDCDLQLARSTGEIIDGKVRIGPFCILRCIVQAVAETRIIAESALVNRELYCI